MKKLVMFGLLLGMFGVVALSGCGGGGDGGNGGGSVIPPPNDNITLTTNLSLTNYTYSIGSPDPQAPIIKFGVGIRYNGNSIYPTVGEVIWSYTGPNLGNLIDNGNQAIFNVNGSTGTIVVKAEYKDLSATVTINIVP